MKWISSGIYNTLAWRKPVQGRDLNQPVYFVTSRDEKFNEVQTLLEGIPLKKVSFPIPTLERVDDIVETAVFRVLKAHKEMRKNNINAPCFLEETKLNVKVPGYKKEYPGRYYKEMCEDHIGRPKFAEENNDREANLQSVFAYTEDGETVHIFTGESKGMIVNPGKNWVEVDGWEPFFVPDGYKKPLSELREFKNIVNMRQFPVLQMRSVMREKDYPGVYETHITVANCAQPELDANGKKNPLAPTPEYIKAFQVACEELGVKPLEIGMDDPKKPIQLQTAAYNTFKNAKDAQIAAHQLAEKLLKKGFPTHRVRIEAMLRNTDCPRTDDEALKADPGNYFEFHARMEAVAQERFAEFQKIIERYNREQQGSHAKGKIKASYSSVNAPDRFFVNSRSWKVGSETALTLWRRMLEDLKAAGFKIAKEIPYEYTVYDQKPGLDYEKVSTEDQQKKNTGTASLEKVVELPK